MNKLSKTNVSLLIDLYKTGNFTTLEKKSEELINAHKDECFLYNMLGVALLEQRKFDKAIKNFNKAILIKNDYAEAYYNLGNLYRINEKLDNAISSYLKAVQINKNYAEAYNNLGLTLKQQGRIDEAIKNYKKTILINPNLFHTYNNIGNALKQKGDFNAAIDNFKKAIKINVDYAEAYNNMGLTLQKQFKFDDALNNFKKAISIKPNFHEAYNNLGYLNLMCENFAEGWKYYEFRKARALLIKSNKLSIEKLWNGEKFYGKLMVFGEQGLGDEILFSSILNSLLKSHNNITVKINERLIPLFKRSFKKIKFISQKSKVKESDYKKYIFLGSLGKHYRNSVESFPNNQKSFLFPNLIKKKNFNNNLEKKKLKRIGISWKKSLPEGAKNLSLNDFHPILLHNQYQFIDLQYGDTKNERSNIKKLYNISLIHFKSLNYKNDIDSLAALMSNCDLIITSANFTAQLAGALGIPVWVLLPHIADWRWFLKRNGSLWYPNMRLFRQTTRGDWKNIIHNVNKQLKNFN